MAEVIEEYEFKRQGKKHYPDEWFDGQIRVLTSDDVGSDENEGAAGLKSKVAALKMAAGRRGQKLQVNLDEENYDVPVLVIQSVATDEEEPPKKRRKKK